MDLSISERIRLIMRRQSVTVAELARRTEQTPQNLSNKLSRDNFQVAELDKIAEALDCRLELAFVLPDGSRI